MKSTVRQGMAATPTPTGVVINEVLSQPADGQTDRIELYNAGDTVVDLNHFYLSDSSSSADTFAKFALPTGSLAPGAYLVFSESDFNAGGEDNPNRFGLSGTTGDELFLTVGDANGPTHFVDSVSFGAAAPGESFGRTPNGNGRLYPLVSQTFNAENSLPRVGPLVITELMFAPGNPSPAALAIDPLLSRDNLEYIEIFNPTAEPVTLTEWRLRLGADFDFDADTQLSSQQSLVVVPFNSENTVRLSAFRTHYGLDDTVQIVGGFGGQLSTSGDGVQLQRPGANPQNGTAEHSAVA